MKPIREQNFYELFDLKPDATREQIEQAYQLAKKTYGENSLAAYSLFDSDERREAIQKIGLAYETLRDEERRKQYDRDVMDLDTLTETDSRQIESVTEKTSPVAEGPRPPEPLPAGPLPDMETLTGATLRDYRERLKIPLQEIANKTRVTVTYFEYLEKDHYRFLPPPVYLSSYIIQYARILGLDPERVANRMLALVEESRRPKKE